MASTRKVTITRKEIRPSHTISTGENTAYIVRLYGQFLIPSQQPGGRIDSKNVMLPKRTFHDLPRALDMAGHWLKTGEAHDPNDPNASRRRPGRTLAELEAEGKFE